LTRTMSPGLIDRVLICRLMVAVRPDDRYRGRVDGKPT
jgi:hypothetical protein